MKGQLANKGRCPKCTLKPPCKHYESMEAMNEAVAVQETPDKAAYPFYPAKEASITHSEVTSNKYQRSDGFSVTSN